MSERMIRGITFDLWHTVLREPVEDFSGFLRRKRTRMMMEVFHNHNLPLHLEGIERAYDVQTERLWQIWNRGVDIDQKAQIGIMLSELGIPADQVDEALVEDLLRPYNDAISLVPPVPLDGAGELFTSLKNRGMSLGIISNTGRTHGDFFRGLLGKYDLARYFDVMMFSNEIGIRKPNREIFLKTLEKMDISPEEAMHVGDDSDNDIIGARKAGMRTILVLLPGRDPDRGHPDFVVSKVQEVLRVVEELEGAD